MFLGSKTSSNSAGGKSTNGSMNFATATACGLHSGVDLGRI